MLIFDNILMRINSGYLHCNYTKVGIMFDKHGPCYMMVTISAIVKVHMLRHSYLNRTQKLISDTRLDAINCSNK